MRIELLKKPKNPIIIEAFPGFGLVGTIAAEFLIEHLQTELIGTIWFDKMPAITAIHEEKLVQPLGLFYNKKFNIVILHAITNVKGIEWKLSDALLDVAKQLNAKEIISLEGVGAPGMSTTGKVFFYTNQQKKKDALKKLGIAPLKEGIIMGVTSTLMLKVKEHPMTCIFAETTTNLPDSKAAANVIQVLDQYLDLDVDTKPLLEQAKKFEEKLKIIMSQTEQSQQISDKKRLDYLG
ncbi:MAG TPA: PAC2 family protein [Candidatus Nanoarchaeia archaeon]|nr:PAC2 family protein [Candidatus Nanoarchaeia archaeon]